MKQNTNSYKEDISLNKNIGWFKKYYKSKIIKSILIILFLFLIIVSTILIFNYHHTKEDVIVKPEIESTLQDKSPEIKDFKKGDLVLKIKWEDGNIYFNLEVKGNYYKTFNNYNRYEDEYIKLIFVDKDNFTLNEIKIKAYDFSIYKNKELLKYGSNKKMDLEIYNRITNVSYSSNFLF